MGESPFCLAGEPARRGLQPYETRRAGSPAKQNGDSPMNICLISQEYPPESGGGGIGTQTY
ncbi:MAG TPA: hypothetical protein VHY37_06060, partial [Tepidisphaeraceae bacterium]|nr:hypothetical protein [Tepidisphaeraceae bacterium]